MDARQCQLYDLLVDLDRTLRDVHHAVSTRRRFLKEFHELREFSEELSRIESTATRISDQVSITLDALDEPVKHQREPLSEEEVQSLGRLNRQFVEISRFLRERAAEINPVMQARVADPADPLIDYEIQARI